MTWPDYLLVATGVLYFAAAIGYALHDKPGLSLAFAAYSLANVGLLWAALEK